MLIPYYEEENITIYHGDCLEVMPQLTQKFDAIIADLPYGKTQNEWDTIINLDKLWENYKRLGKINTPYIFTASQPFTSMLVMSNLEWFKWEDIWKKSSITGHLNCKIMPLRQHENILIFCRGRVHYFPQIERKKIDLIRGTPRYDTKSLNYGNYNKNDIEQTIPLNMTYPRSIVEVNTSYHEGNAGLHPNQKPLALLQYLIKTYTNEGDIILDNTMGSGTTLVAAKIEGRKAVGIELKEEYCQIAVQRLKEVNPFYQKPSKKKDTPYEGFDMEDWLNE